MVIEITLFDGEARPQSKTTATVEHIADAEELYENLAETLQQEAD